MKHIILIILLCLFKLPAWAQQTVSAHVVDSETGEALPYVNIYISSENMRERHCVSRYLEPAISFGACGIGNDRNNAQQFKQPYA